jgi:hypothetical protein
MTQKTLLATGCVELARSPAPPASAVAEDP